MMSAIGSILVFVLLFVGFGLVSRGKDQRSACHSCPKEENQSAREGCPRPAKRVKSKNHIRLER
jgi:hypothetical protein